MRPYTGIRVVDLSQGVAGPYCGMLLAQNGADVIKIEPSTGDWSRILGQVHGEHTAFSIPANLGKRSIVMDLKHAASREIVDRMVHEADVFIEGFRPGVTDRLGYGYERLKSINPGLIYVSVSGFGQTGPMRERPAMDPMLQAFTGFMSENKGADGIPHRTPVIFFDMSTGLYAQQAVASTLFSQRVHGMQEGRHIQISLMEAAAGIQAIRVMSGYREGPFKIAAAPSGTFATADGWLQIIVVKDREMEKFAAAMGHPQWADDPRFKTSAARREHVDLLTGMVRELMAAKPTAHWQEVLSAAGLQNETVQDYRAFVDHPQTAAVGVISWLPQAGSEEPWPVPNVPGLPRLEPGSPYAISPTPGQHTREIMAEIGYDAATIEDLVSRGVIT
ncbi:MAG: CoA transferase [Alphaproteobacteria bacterium]|nr:CoA transferase [Alphaproteobacteria bacterium]